MKAKCTYCGKEVDVKPSRLKRCKNFCCSRECSNKLKETVYLGVNNPNKKYNYDEKFFEKIDSEFKAWVLGWIASDGHIDKKGSKIHIEIHLKDKGVINQIRDGICKDIPIRTNLLTQRVSLTINSKNMAKDVCNHLSIGFGKKDTKVRFPKLESKELGYCFLRGYFEGDGHIRQPHSYRRCSPECGITSNSHSMLQDIADFVEKGYRLDFKHNNISWQGLNAIDFLGKIYDNAYYFMSRKRDLYYDICMWRPRYKRFTLDKIEFCKTRPDAVKPSKTNASDSGYDITLLEKISSSGNVEIYDTGLKMTPPEGLYFDLVPRSSITKTGYMLANNVGIIDRGYIGNIMVPLVKIDPNAPDLELPKKLVQIVPRVAYHFEIVEVDDLEDSSRGDGGFGSTDKEVKQ